MRVVTTTSLRTQKLYKNYSTGREPGAFCEQLTDDSDYTCILRSGFDRVSQTLFSKSRIHPETSEAVLSDEKPRFRAHLYPAAITRAPDCRPGCHDQTPIWVPGRHWHLRLNKRPAASESESPTSRFNNHDSLAVLK